MIDFIRLYRELGIAPDCSLEAFKQAYRRRVGELHPDRTADDAAAVNTLKDLNLCYSAALDFHRQHGRLPGALPHGTVVGMGPGTTAGTSPGTGGEHATDALRPPPATESARPRRRRPRPVSSDPKFLHSRTFWLVLTALLLAAVWYFGNLPTEEADHRYEQLPPAAGAAPASRLHSLTLGMPGSDVAGLLGEPVGRDEYNERWIYGPSWVEFECDRVVDWYSSRLKPLPVDAPRPEHANPDRHDKRRGAHCPPALLRGAGIPPSSTQPALHAQGY